MNVLRHSKLCDLKNQDDVPHRILYFTTREKQTQKSPLRKGLTVRSFQKQKNFEDHHAPDKSVSSGPGFWQVVTGTATRAALFRGCLQRRLLTDPGRSSSRFVLLPLMMTFSRCVTSPTTFQGLVFCPADTGVTSVGGYNFHSYN